ncbi:NADH-quinone oxidoreductase subunit C [Ruminococcus sp. CLA-AA-H200]|uniref:NADH-quinone oxidoreductase subunit C n=1 Tax=Ruminococcus turbiniformis TaxID=2881258 RepID=A0ABS8FVA2_9FIRM|nr:NADH-quinone oxidoreductase subunit C [Ruminococcus turbiniformis]MCC2253921.1 NADH-quinone oxidoreductase subunit C [Ruminococcus turbiniformis]
MAYQSEIKETAMADFFPAVVKMKTDQWRLVQICAVSVEGGYEMSYSFCKDYEMVTLRLNVAEEEEIASITQIYPCAFLQENEAAQLFGVKIVNIRPDYRDRLYRIDETAPFKTKE